MSFGSRLQAARERAGLTQKTVADALGVTTQAISLWERDKNHPEASRIVSLGRLYKIDLEWLLDTQSSNDPMPSENAVRFQGRTPLIDPVEIIDFYLSLDFKNLVLRQQHILLVDTIEWPGQSFAIRAEKAIYVGKPEPEEIFIFNNAVIPSPGDIVAAMEKHNGSLRPMFGVFEGDHTINGIPTNIPVMRDTKNRKIVDKMLRSGIGATVVGTAVERRKLLRT